LKQAIGTATSYYASDRPRLLFTNYMTRPVRADLREPKQVIASWRHSAAPAPYYYYYKLSVCRTPIYGLFSSSVAGHLKSFFINSKTFELIYL